MSCALVPGVYLDLASVNVVVIKTLRKQSLGQDQWANTLVGRVKLLLKSYWQSD